MPLIESNQLCLDLAARLGLQSLHAIEKWELRRWLVAANNDLDQAERLVLAMWDWRERETIDELVLWRPSPKLSELYPAEFCGIDDFGAPVWRIHFGAIDFQGFLASASESEFVRYTLRIVELSLHWAMHHAVNNNNEFGKCDDNEFDKCGDNKCDDNEFGKFGGQRDANEVATPKGQVVVFDLRGLSLRLIASKNVLGLVTRLATLQANFYPETLSLAVVIGANWLFAKAFKIVAPFLDQRTLEKVLILGDDPDNWGSELASAKHVSVPNLVRKMLEDAGQMRANNGAKEKTKKPEMSVNKESLPPHLENLRRTAGLTTSSTPSFPFNLFGLRRAKELRAAANAAASRNEDNSNGKDKKDGNKAHNGCRVRVHAHSSIDVKATVRDEELMLSWSVRPVKGVVHATLFRRPLSTQVPRKNTAEVVTEFAVLQQAKAKKEGGEMPVIKVISPTNPITTETTTKTTATSKSEFDSTSIIAVLEEPAGPESLIEDMSEAEEVLARRRKLSGSKELFEGSIRCDPGFVYTLSMENSSSLLMAATIDYDVRIRAMEQTEAIVEDEGEQEQQARIDDLMHFVKEIAANNNEDKANKAGNAAKERQEDIKAH